MNADRLLAHFDRIADAPDAVPRLRRFILDLAVRGKLVEQDPNDEPAIKFDGAIPTDLIPPFDIPENWNWARLCAVGELKGGGTPSKARHDFWDGDIPWVSPKDMKIDYIARAQMTISEAAIAGSAANVVKPGSVLFVVRGMILAHSFPVAVTRVPLAINQDMKALVLQNPEMAEYMLRVLRGMKPEMLKRVQRSSHGTCRIERSDYKDFLIPLPPLAEQHRIVSKVDELMALCDRLEAARTEREATRDQLAAASLADLNAPDPDPTIFQNHAAFALEILPPLTARVDQIKQLRQTILNLAVRGKLVEQDPNDEPASELLKRIAEKEEEKRGNKSQRRKRLPEVSRLAEDDALPFGWQRTRLGEIAVSMRYGTSIKCEYSSQGTPVLRIPNVSSGKITLDDIKFGSLSPAEIGDLSLRAGDLLLIRSNGSLDIVGRAAVVTGEAEGILFAGYLVRLRTNTAIIDPNYIWLATNSSEIRDQIEGPIRSTVGLKNVNLKEFGALTFLLPPLAEQHRIVAKVDELMALCDQLEKSLATGDDTRCRLLDALLHAALEPVKGQHQCVV